MAPNTRLRRTAAGLALPAVLLAGCVNLAPDYVRPAAPVPQAWASAAAARDAAGLTAAAPSDIGWREFFVDARLRGVVELALANNRDLRVAALNIERARAQYGVVSASAFPAIGAGASGTRSRTPGSVSASGQARLATQYNVNLGLASYELDLFGRVRNLGDAALESFFGHQADLRAADQQRLQLARDTLASRQKSYDLVERSHALGAQSGLTLAQSRTTVDTARADAAAFDAQVEQSRNALDLLAGGSVPAALLPPPTATMSPSPAAQLLAPPAELPSTVLLQRPDVLAAEHALRASNANIGAARAAFYPRIALTGSAGTASSSLSGLFESGSAAWNFAPSISLPIFDGGANRANLGVAQAQQQIQLATYEKTLQVAFREVADVLAARRTLGERLAAQQSLVAATTRAFELSDALFRSGGAGYLDVLDAQRSLYTVQQSLISLQLIEQANRITLYRTLGGGWRTTADEAQVTGSGTAPVSGG